MLGKGEVSARVMGRRGKGFREPVPIVTIYEVGSQLLCPGLLGPGADAKGRTQGQGLISTACG